MPVEIGFLYNIKTTAMIAMQIFAICSQSYINKGLISDLSTFRNVVAMGCCIIELSFDENSYCC